ncbi:MAG: hypothetical protein LBR70_05175 [Lactobacillaceae bacterium]|jgi:hypothetical protein|nr:hypothetical protein [Lactobacillaceae bacterium]
MMEYYDTKKMSDKEIKQAFIKCFSTKEGKVALSFLRRITTERYLGPDCSEGELRHLEGQRHLVGYIASLSSYR